MTTQTPPPEPAGDGAGSPAPTSEQPRRNALAYAKQIVGIIALVLLVAWVSVNTQDVEVNWLVRSTEGPLALLLFVAAAIGWLIGLITPAFIRFRARHRRPPR